MITKTTKKKAFDRLLSFDKALIGITESLNLDEIINNAVNELGQILDIDRCFFAGITFKEWVIQVESLSDTNTLSLLGTSGPLDPDFPLVRNFIENGFLVVNDVEKKLLELEYEQIESGLGSHTDFLAFTKEHYKQTNIRSCVYIAITINGHICGALGFHRNTHQERRRYKWNQEEIELLKIVGKQVSKAISESQLINDLKISNERLLELDKLKSQIMSTVSHELKTPMANILGFSELLLHRDYEADIQKNYLSEIYNSSKKLSSLITDFLDLSRIEAKGEILLNAFEECDIDWLAEKAWQEVNGRNESHNISWRIEENIPYAFVDSSAITRVFTNLFSNAIKYSPQGSSITCSIKTNLNELIVSIEDQGIGIVKDMIDSIFDRFVRVDNSSTRTVGGTGLGLWICKQIILAHNGQIWCESEEGKGSCFNFVLPAINVELGEKDAQTNNAQIWLY